MSFESDYLEAWKSDLLTDCGVHFDTPDEQLPCLAAIVQLWARKSGIELTGTMAWIRGERDRLRDLHLEAGHRQEP